LQLFLASRLLWWKAAEVQLTILGGLMLEHLVDIHEKHWLEDLLRFLAVPEWYAGFVGLKNLYIMLENVLNISGKIFGLAIQARNFGDKC